MLRFILACIWEGIAASVIAGTTAIMSMQSYPQDTWQYVVIGCGALAAGFKAVDAYRRTPH